MEKPTSASATRALSHRVGCLEEREFPAYTVLTEVGPSVQLGDVEFSEEVWNHVSRHCLWFAIDMHQCGYWGPITDVDYARNEQSPETGGSVVSRWTFVNVDPFWITTDTSGPRNRTTVFMSPESD